MPKAVLLAFALSVVVPAAYGQSSLRQVDFLNFKFSLPWCSKTFEGDIPSTVTVKNGHFKRGDSYVSVDKKNILYADLTGDGAEEAVVPVLCGPLHANYTGNDEVLIFTLQHGSPELLADLDEDNFQRDYERFYKSAYLSAESRVRVASNKIIIDKTSGECHACSDTYRNIALQYQWNGRAFSLVGKPMASVMTTLVAPVPELVPTPSGTPLSVALSPEQQKQLHDLIDNAKRAGKAVSCTLYIGKQIVYPLIWIAGFYFVPTQAVTWPVPGLPQVYLGQCDSVAQKDLPDRKNLKTVKPNFIPTPVPTPTPRSR